MDWTPPSQALQWAGHHLVVQMGLRMIQKYKLKSLETRSLSCLSLKKFILYFREKCYGDLGLLAYLVILLQLLSVALVHDHIFRYYSFKFLKFKFYCETRIIRGLHGVR